MGQGPSRHEVLATNVAISCQLCTSVCRSVEILNDRFEKYCTFYTSQFLKVLNDISRISKVR